MPYTYSKLRGRIVERYGTIGNLGKALKLSKTSMSAKLNGKTGFDQKDIIEWSKLLDISNDEIGTYFFT